MVETWCEASYSASSPPAGSRAGPRWWASATLGGIGRSGPEGAAEVARWGWCAPQAFPDPALPSHTCSRAPPARAAAATPGSSRTLRCTAARWGEQTTSSTSWRVWRIANGARRRPFLRRVQAAALSGPQACVQVGCRTGGAVSARRGSRRGGAERVVGSRGCAARAGASDSVAPATRRTWRDRRAAGATAPAAYAGVARRPSCRTLRTAQRRPSACSPAPRDAGPPQAEHSPQPGRQLAATGGDGAYPHASVGPLAAGCDTGERCARARREGAATCTCRSSTLTLPRCRRRLQTVWTRRRGSPRQTTFARPAAQRPTAAARTGRLANRGMRCGASCCRRAGRPRRLATTCSYRTATRTCRLQTQWRSRSAPQG